MPSRRALLVDDDEATLAVFRRILQAEQWEVEALTSALRAAEQIRAGSRYDVIVSDIHMPDLNGMDFYAAAVEAAPELRHRFVFVSGYADSEQVEKFLLECGCPSIRKPIRIEDFRLVIKHLAEGTPLEAAALPSSWFTPESLPLYSGEIRGPHTVFTLLNRIYAARLTGILELASADAERKLYFNLGQLVFAVSSAPRGQAAARDPTGAATRALDTTSGRYAFYDAFEENIVPSMGIVLPLGRLLLDAVRAAGDLPLEDFAHDENLAVDLSPDPLLTFQDVRLNATEQAVLSTVTRPLPAAEVFRASGLQRAEAARALYALMALGMVIAVALPRAAAPPAPEPPLPAGADAAAAAEAPPAEDVSPATFGEEIRRYLERIETGNYYQILEVRADAPPDHFKPSFYRLARRFHPDRHMGHSEWIDSLQNIMEALTLAYKTLSDPEARAKYDKHMAEAGAYAIAREKTKKQETAEECLEKAKECLRAQNYPGSIVWLKKCVELAPGVSKYRALLGRSLAAVPQYRREAVEQFERAIALDAWNMPAYMQLGELYEQMGLPWRARPLYQKVLDVDQDHARAREALTRVDAKEGKKKKAGLLDTLTGLFKRK